MHFTTLFFDLDDTLYPSGNGLWDAICERMSTYMAERLGIPWEQIPDLRRSYFETYGTTMRGLQIHYNIDPDDYLVYVHDLPLEEYIKPSPALHAFLRQLPQRRWVFTNADAGHAQRVLNILGIEECFEGIIDVRAIKFACKPEAIAYKRALTQAGESDPSRCVILDDSVKNLVAAHKLDFTTILVGSNGVTDPSVTYSVPDIFALSQVIPELWEQN
ncbi:MAG: pyrimidine 5'-nucleotidase [Chloroflexota bacterium]|nr:pyrimidine 5'-nucleotidase [Chloroflexota bacterium]